MNALLKTLVRQVTPPILISFGKAIFQRERQSLHKTQHEERNRNAKQDEIVLRDHLTLKLHPESRHGFEYFCYRAPENIGELDCFIKHTQDRSRLLDVGALHGIFSLAFAIGHPE